MKIIQAWAHPLAFHHHCYFTNSIDLVIVTVLGSFPGVVGRVLFQCSIYFSLSPSRRSLRLAHLQLRKRKQGNLISFSQTVHFLLPILSPNWLQRTEIRKMKDKKSALRSMFLFLFYFMIKKAFFWKNKLHRYSVLHQLSYQAIWQSTAAVSQRSWVWILSRPDFFPFSGLNFTAAEVVCRTNCDDQS